MNYPTGQKIKIGDSVVADGMIGVVVCDFDSREFLEAYAGWDMADVEMLGGGKLSSGIMIETVQAGLVDYEGEGSGDIVKR